MQRCLLRISSSLANLLKHLSSPVLNGPNVSSSSESHKGGEGNNEQVFFHRLTSQYPKHHRPCPWMHLSSQDAQLIFCRRAGHLPWILHGFAPFPGGSREPKVSFSTFTGSSWTLARRLGPHFTHPEVGVVPGHGLWLPVPQLKGTQQRVGSYLGQSWVGVGFNSNRLWLVLPKNTPFQQHRGPRCLSQHGEGVLVAQERSQRGDLTPWRSHGLQPRPLSAHAPCVLPPAMPVRTVPIQLKCTHTPNYPSEEALGVGKGNSAKRRRLEARCLLTCNASRGPAGSAGLSFIFYKGCCLLQHVPGTQVGVTSCSAVPLEVAPRSRPVSHQPRT